MQIPNVLFNEIDDGSAKSLRVLFRLINNTDAELLPEQMDKLVNYFNDHPDTDVETENVLKLVIRSAMGYRAATVKKWAVI